MQKIKMRCLLVLGSLVASTIAQTKLKIMPMGDSITEIDCWRTILWGNLQSAGVTNSIDFVGSMSNNAQNCQGVSGWDQNHEGHSGYLAINIANNNLPGWLASAKPDVVMFHLGTNDITGNHAATEILASFTKMVGQMRASNPKMRIIVDQIIPIGFGNYAALPALNSAIPGWASGLSTAQSPIVVVDLNTGYPTSALRDGLHPNAAGDAIIASRIYPVLLNQIKSALGSSTAPTSTAPVNTAATTTSPPAATTTQSNPGTGSGGGGAAVWAQCGGSGWTGPTSCASGTCKYSNAYYSQCIP